MRYVTAIEKGNKKQGYGVVVPDLPGCFSAGDTLDEALSNAKEAILLHLEGLMEVQSPVPSPKSLERHQKDRKYKGWMWAVIEVDLAELDDKTERVNITLPRKVLRVIDAAAKRSGESRSGYLARVGIESARQVG
ncbi:MAG: type II toxin-antitoxin system HicB family antitoxin [Acidiferrobacteraceae bacterium]